MKRARMPARDAGRERAARGKLRHAITTNKQTAFRGLRAPHLPPPPEGGAPRRLPRPRAARAHGAGGTSAECVPRRPARTPASARVRVIYFGGRCGRERAAVGSACGHGPAPLKRRDISAQVGTLGEGTPAHVPVPASVADPARRGEGPPPGCSASRRQRKKPPGGSPPSAARLRRADPTKVGVPRRRRHLR